MRFDNDCAQCPAAQSIDRCLEQLFRISNHRKQAVLGPSAEVRPAIGLHHARLSHRTARAQPERRAILTISHCRQQREGKTGRRSCILVLRGVKFMHPSISQPAAQRGIERRHTTLPPPQITLRVKRRIVCTDPQQTLFAPEGGQQRITDSHMFLLCSILNKGQAAGVPMRMWSSAVPALAWRNSRRG